MSKPTKGKKFVYSLQTLLKVRDIRERQQQEKFNEAERKTHEERLKETKIKEEQLQHLNYVHDMLSSKELPSFTTIQMHQQHVKTMQERVKKQIEVVKSAEKKQEEERLELVQKSKEKRIIEKDREKTRDAWKKMMDKIDSQFLDEISSIKFASTMLNEEESK